MKNKKQLIDANEAEKAITDIYCGTAGYRARERLWQAVEAIKEIPTVDAVEVVHGRWIELPSLIGLPWKVQCDQCGCPQDYKHNYCPNCGAKMKG